MDKAIILAAGKGTKIWPYGEFRQKCTVPVANKPIVRWLVENLLAVGIKQIIVVVGHHKQQIRGAVGDFAQVKFVNQSVGASPVCPPEGTAPAVLTAIEQFDNFDDSGGFIVLYGDVVTGVENFRLLIDEFEKSGAEAAAMVQRLEHEPGCDWLCAGVSSDKISGIEGHPRGGTYRLCGIYAFKKSVKEYLLRNPGLVTKVPVGGMPPIEAEIAQSIQVMLDDNREVLALPTVEFFVDVDKPWHILEANARLISYLTARLDKDAIAASAKISDAAEINGRVMLGENSHIGPRVVVKGNLIAGKNNNITNGAILGADVVIGDKCRISDYCYVSGRTAIGNECIVGHGAEMAGILMDKVYLYHYCEMSGIFGCATDIGAATVCGTLRFDDRDTPHKIKGRLEIPHYGANETYMGDYCRTGVNAIIMPGCKIGSYSVVGPGVILSEDVPSKTMVLAKQELVKKPWGPERYGW